MLRTHQPFFTGPALILVCCAFIMNLLFLYMHIALESYKSQGSYGVLHPNIAYNLCKHGVCKLDTYIHSYLLEKTATQGGLVSLAGIEGAGQYVPFLVNDTIGYGLVFALLWKLTGSFVFFDMQVLQILLFSFLMMLVYHTAYMLFSDTRIAFFSGIAHLLFFPLIAMNIHPVRDIWAYYGLLIFLYYCAKFFTQGFQLRFMVYGAFWLSLLQCIRPTLFTTVLTSTLFCLGYLSFSFAPWRKIIQGLFVLYCVNIVVFWVPFMAYNKHTYDRFIVGPFGQDLVEGLGEFPNVWGFKLDDVWLASFIKTKYGYELGTPEADDAACAEFNEALREDPIFYFKTLAWRLPQVVLPGLPWLFYVQSPYQLSLSLCQKIKISFSSVSGFIDFFLRQLYIRFYLMLGYIGIFYVLWRRQYRSLFFLLICGLLASLGKFPSHIEYRYLVPYYWVFSFFIGSACVGILRKYKSFKAQYNYMNIRPTFFSFLILSIKSVLRQVHLLR